MAEKKVVAKKAAQGEEMAPIAYDTRCLTINGSDTLVFSAAFHYFRCPKALWEDRFIKIAKAGFNAVETYIPWNWHEREEGDARLGDLEEWLDMAARFGLFIIVRPGPYICAEWDGGGHPGWLAGRGINWRTDSEDCISWSRYWYEQVMPVIAPRQVTQGGRIIMVQVENEYEYAAADDAVKTRYIAALTDIARELGIDVPIFTCRTPVAWDRANPQMARVFDTWTFYPWWDFAGVEKNVAMLQEKQPDAPSMIMELQGGWYSEIGGKILRHTELNGAQVSALTKTCLGRGVTGLNYYMFFGGTHPGHWGFPPATTSYDYGAPLSEPGGLWEKWYSVKMMGDFLGTFGPLLARSVAVEGMRTETPGVAVFARENNGAVFAFLRNDTDEAREVRFDLPPKCHSQAVATKLAPRQCKVFPFGAELGRLTIERCTAQIQGLHRKGNRWILLLADEPGSYELSVRIQDGVINSTISWDATGRLTQVHPRLTVWGQPPARAERTWAVDTSKGPAILSTGSYLLREAVEKDGIVTATVETRPGEASLRALLPTPKPALTESRLRTPEMPAGAVQPADQAWSAEDLRAGDGWKPAGGKPLNELEWHDKGFYRYRGEFEWKGEKGIKVATLADDSPVVAINGRVIKGMSGSDRIATGPLEGLAREGKNTIEILCENRGRSKFGEGMEEVKGLKAVELLPEWLPERRLPDWQYAEAGETEPGPGFEAASWKDIRLAGAEMEGLFDFRGWLFARATLDLSAGEAAADANLRVGGARGEVKAWANGTALAGGMQGSARFFSAKGALKAGSNTIALAVRKSGAFNGVWGPVSLGFSGDGRAVEGLEFAPSLARMPGNLGTGDWGASAPADAALAWHRSKITLPASKGWNIPWKLAIESDNPARIFLNGEHIGNFFPVGPQFEFYLPECYLKAEGENELAIAVIGGNAALKKLSVEPYAEYAVYRHEVKLAI